MEVQSLLQWTASEVQANILGGGVFTSPTKSSPRSQLLILYS